MPGTSCRAWCATWRWRPDKKIELTMLGADTELDRQVLELIKDPLTHMVRNSGDHGLETPAERRAAGKPETGRITLNAYPRGRPHHHRDRRRRPRPAGGPDPRQGAGATAWRPRPNSAAMTEAQMQRFIFRAGFSTAAEVTACPAAASAWTWCGPTSRRSAAPIDLKSVAGAGHDLHHQDPADPGDRLGADRARRAASASPFRRSAWSNWCARRAGEQVGRQRRRVRQP